MSKFSISVEPMGAVRMTRKGKFKNPYAQRYLSYKDVLSWTIKKDAPRELLHGAVEIKRLRFYMPIPESFSKKKKTICATEEVPHISKPDIDNLIKGLKDSLNGIVWEDDRMVFSVQDVKKLYSPNPRIEIEVDEV